MQFVMIFLHTDPKMAIHTPKSMSSKLCIRLTSQYAQADIGVSLTGLVKSKTCSLKQLRVPGARLYNR